MGLHVGCEGRTHRVDARRAPRGHDTLASEAAAAAAPRRRRRRVERIAGAQAEEQARRARASPSSAPGEADGEAQARRGQPPRAAPGPARRPLRAQRHADADLAACAARRDTPSRRRGPSAASSERQRRRRRRSSAGRPSLHEQRLADHCVSWSSGCHGQVGIDAAHWRCTRRGEQRPRFAGGAHVDVMPEIGLLLRERHVHPAAGLARAAFDLAVLDHAHHLQVRMTSRREAEALPSGSFVAQEILGEASR